MATNQGLSGDLSLNINSLELKKSHLLYFYIMMQSIMKKLTTILIQSYLFHIGCSFDIYEIYIYTRVPCPSIHQSLGTTFAVSL